MGYMLITLIQFLLTHPLWDVTLLIYQKTLVELFLLTHPLWDVTKAKAEEMGRTTISTHTSLVGCDRNGEWYANDIRNFYSHIPCGM